MNGPSTGPEVGRLRRGVAKAARRLERRLDPGAATKRARANPATAPSSKALGSFYSSVSRIVGIPAARGKGTPEPSPGHIAQIKRTLKSWAATDQFFSAVAHDVPVETALAAAAREMIRVGSVDTVASLANSIGRHSGLQAVGEVLSGMVALEREATETAWLVFSERRELAIQVAPAEYFRAGFMMAPDVAGRQLRQALDADAIEAEAAQWFDIAATSFVSRFEAESHEALSAARTSAEAHGDERQLKHIEWLERWYGRADRAAQPATAPAGAVPFAVLDYKQPDEAYASKNLGDHVQTIASLGHLVRREGFSFTGDPETLSVVEKLRGRVKTERVISGDEGVIDLHVLQRDASSLDLIPDGTWALAFGWYMHPQFRTTFDMPFNRRLRPIFVSFHVNAPAFLTDETIGYLRKYGPVGCRDWNTVHLLLAAGVPAFFSGCITTTVDTVFPEPANARRAGTVYVDTPPTGPGDFWAQTDPEVRWRSFADNIDEALEVLGGYQTAYDNVVTSRLHCYLPARSLGAEVEFRAKNPADVRFDGLVGIDDTAYEQIRQNMLSRLEPVIGAIGRGASEDEVYAVWREVTAPAVAEAEAVRSSVTELPQAAFDIASTCRVIVEDAVTVERTERGPEGAPVTVVLSGDSDVDVQLAALVAGSSRPLDVRIFCDRHDPDTSAQIAERHPNATVTWWSTEGVNLGGAFTTAKAQEAVRLLMLPELLVDVDRVVRLDRDSLCVGDVAELADLDLANNVIAARPFSLASRASGFATLIRASKRMESDPLARDFILRTHTRHEFDFPAFHPGVTVLDLARMRADGFAEQFLPWIERFGLGVEELLTTYVGADLFQLDSTWNRLPHIEEVGDPKGLSWTGGPKPWSELSVAGQEFWSSVVR